MIGYISMKRDRFFTRCSQGNIIKVLGIRENAALNKGIMSVMLGNTKPIYYGFVHVQTAKGYCWMSEAEVIPMKSVFLIVLIAVMFFFLHRIMSRIDIFLEANRNPAEQSADFWSE